MLKTLVIFFVAVAVSLLGASVSAMDVAPVTAYMSGDITTGLGAVGSAILLLAVLAMGYKWIKGMIFG